MAYITKNKKGRKLQNTKTFYIEGMISKKFRKDYDIKVVDNEKVILTKKVILPKKHKNEK